MGVVLLMVGVRQSYAKTTAEAELIKQYEFMYRIFRNARKRVDDAENDDDRRRILKVLGDSALEEHAQWILIHRERSIDELRHMASDLRQDVFNLKFQHATGQLDNISKLREKRRDLARVETLSREHDLGIRTLAAGKISPAQSK